ncbi:hypothetical protein B0O80DRAFT_432671 [Mortierella sp. GBAus27b]|nr:hypothetical protein B0O80DRAFT_432671 [Mortierella sp. GBAus27b]
MIEDIYQFLVCVGNICIYALIGGIIGSLAIPFIIAVFPCLLGFSVAGIVSGSPAAFLMAQHQGYVPVDSFVARMQSLGQQGWRAGFNSVNMIVGGALGLFFGAFVAVYVQDVCSS